VFLKNFPVTIEPGVAVLEAKLEPAPGASQSGAGHAVLYRLDVGPETFPFEIDALSIHFFGPHEDPADCPFVLIYDANGVWRYIATRNTPDSVWEVTQVPEEVVGRAVKLPSVRLVFDDPEDARVVLAICKRAAAGGTLTTLDLRTLVNRLLGLRDVIGIGVANQGG
jgi:hypothetical protein